MKAKIIKINDVEVDIEIFNRNVDFFGEGLVFTIQGTNDFNTAYKTKGCSHQKSKIRKLPTVDPVKLENMEKAIELHCNEDRLQQIYDMIVLSEEDKTPKKIGEFVRGVIDDVWSEEADSLRESNISRSDFGKSVSRKAASWFKSKIEEF